MTSNLAFLGKYLLRYRTQFLLGLLLAFFVSLLNGVTLSFFIPLFDALGSRSREFLAQFSDKERKILQKAIFLYYSDVSRIETLLQEIKKGPENPAIFVPGTPEKISKELAGTYLYYLNKIPEHKKKELSPVERIYLQLVIRPKLNINQAGYSALKIVFLSALVIFTVYLLKIILHLISIRLIAGSGYKAIRDIRKDMYLKLNVIPLHYFYKEKTGYLMSRLVNDIEFLTPIISSNLRDTVTNFFYFLTHTLFLLYLNYRLFLLSIASTPIVVIPMLLILGKIGKSTQRTQNLLAELSSITQEFISGIRTVRYFSLNQTLLAFFYNKNQRFSWRSFKEIFYVKLGPNIIELVSTLYTLMIIGAGIYFIDDVNFTKGEFFAFLLTTLFLIRPVIQMSNMAGKLQQASTTVERIKEFLSIIPEVKDPPRPRPKLPLKHSIRFENVYFRYPNTDRYVLENINFEVKAGQTVAIVGESGSGKSTLTDLIARFFDPTQGRILFDGIDIREFSIEDHRSRIGIVQQDTFLFYGTIKDNIAYGSPNYSMRDIEKAARLAYVNDFIKSLPEGYDTVIGERGVNLSGGQKQRIAIARAIYYDPEILIFDEATSALDAKSEQLFQRGLARLLKNRTTFIIAHRLSTIERADVIIVLRNGRIEEIGSHEDLLKKNGFYAKLQKISNEILEKSS